MLKRASMALVAAVLLGVCVYLGIRAAANTSFVVWFGLSTALLAPAGFQLLALAISAGQARLMRRLSKVPEIRELMQQADSEEERVRLLEQERERLEEVVRLEARREALGQLQERLVAEAGSLLDELAAVEAEAASLSDENEVGPVLPEVQALHARVEAPRRGDLVISLRGRDYIVDPDVFNALPILGTGFIGLGLRQLQRRAQRRRHA
jgi:hypothetical protein